MKKQNKISITALLLCLILLFSFAGCTAPAQKTNAKTVTLDYTVQTDLLYTNDLSPGPFINGYATIFYVGTVGNKQTEDNSGNTFNLMDANGELFFDTTYDEISGFNSKGLTAVYNRYYKEDSFSEAVSEYYVFNNKKELVETLPDLDAFHEKYYEIQADQPTGFYDRKETNSRGLSVTVKEIETEEGLQYQYCLLKKGRFPASPAGPKGRYQRPQHLGRKGCCLVCNR